MNSLMTICAATVLCASIPCAEGTTFEHFRNAKLAAQLSMNQSTNLAEIEKSVGGLKADLRRYQNEISDDPAKGSEAYGPPRPTPNQEKFLALLEDGPLPGRLRIARERVPKEYWEEIPDQLQVRLSGTRGADDIVAEMWAFHSEQTAHRRDQAERERQALYRQYGVRFGQEPQVNVSQHLLPDGILNPLLAFRLPLRETSRRTAKDGRASK